MIMQREEVTNRIEELMAELNCSLGSDFQKRFSANPFTLDSIVPRSDEKPLMTIGDGIRERFSVGRPAIPTPTAYRQLGKRKEAVQRMSVVVPRRNSSLLFRSGRQ
jgi:hypothetical protein